MTNIFINLFPIFLGIILVIQNGLNEKAQNQIGLLWTILYNNIVFISLTIILLITFFNTNLLPDNLKAKDLKFNFWYLIPGTIGAIFVTGSVVSFDKLGAFKTIIFIVSAQIITSIVWDYFIKNKSLNIFKITGAVLIILGVYIANLKK